MKLFGLGQYVPLNESVLTKSDFYDSRRLLDVGCGSGTFLSRISAMNKNAALFGIDLAPETVRTAKEKLGNKADIRLCDICSDQVPWGDNFFDHVVCTKTFHEFRNAKHALSEIHRILSPQGCVIIADITSFGPARQLFNLLIFRLTRRISKRGDVRLYSEPEIRHLLEECGFRSVTWRRVVKPSALYRGFVATAVPAK